MQAAVPHPPASSPCESTDENHWPMLNCLGCLRIAAFTCRNSLTFSLGRFIFLRQWQKLATLSSLVFCCIAGMVGSGFHELIMPECTAPTIEFQDNYRGDPSKVVFHWEDPPGCEYFLEGTQSLDVEAPNASWFILQPTITFRKITFNKEKGLYAISKPLKRVIVDLNQSDITPSVGSPYAPMVWYVRPRLWI